CCGETSPPPSRRFLKTGDVRIVETKILIYLVAIMIAGIACITDLRSRRISNRLVVTGLGIGLVLNLLLGSWAGLGWSLLGGLLGLALFFPFFALGGMGAGDV